MDRTRLDVVIYALYDYDLAVAGIENPDSLTDDDLRRLAEERKAIRYVGKSTRPTRRWKDELARASRKSDQPRLSAWLRRRRRVGAIVLETCAADLWRESERRWIKYHRDLGFDLVNLTDGGDGHTSESARINWERMSPDARSRSIAALTPQMGDISTIPRDILVANGRAAAIRLNGYPPSEGSRPETGGAYERRAR